MPHLPVYTSNAACPTYSLIPCIGRGERPSKLYLKVAPGPRPVAFVSLNFTDYVSMALCMGDNRVGDTSDLLDLPQEMGLARRGSF